MCNNQMLNTIYEIMQLNNISLEELIEFIDNKNTPTVNSSFSYSYGKDKKWGDEAVELDELEQSSEPEQLSEPEQSNSWVSIIKKTKNNKTMPIIKKQSSSYSDSKSEKKNNKEIVYTVHEFVACIKNKKKLHIDFTIDPEAHCDHTFQGTICHKVKQCGKIHIQRCMNNLDCQYKHCQFLHLDDMPNDDAKDNFMDTMNEFNQYKYLFNRFIKESNQKILSNYTIIDDYVLI